MSITFAGVPLLLEDQDGQLDGWLARNLPIDDMRIVSPETAARACTRNEPRSNARARVGIPLPNWPSPPNPKINTLYWPCTGASRWAVGYFLTDSDDLKKIRESVGESKSGDLKINLGGTEIGVPMFMLAPRKLTAKTGKGISEAWLLTLVDQRYFWQFKDTQTLRVAYPATSWQSLIDAIALGLGVSIDNSAIPAEYQKPDPIELTRQYENVAVMLDAVAECLGQRVVVNGDSVALMDPSESDVAYKANFEESTNLALAGGKSANAEGIMPGAVRVVFPKTVNWKLDPDGDVYALERWSCCYLDTDARTMPSGTAKTIFDAAMANYLSKDDAEPNNKTTLEIITDRIARDFYAWRKRIYDYTFAGLAEWAVSGYDDYLFFHLGSRHNTPRSPQKDTIEESPYLCYTRVCSLPYDYGVSEMLHQVGELTIVTTTTSTTTTTTTGNPSAAANGCQGTCKFVWSAENCSWSLSEDGCNTTTTTTTSSTTTTTGNPSTPSTPPPCECMSSASTTTSTSTSTTPEPTTTTTWTPQPCQCLYPSYCGESDGECTVTYCVPPAYVNVPADCAGCATTTTGDPNTTTLDPCEEWLKTTTTNTIPPECTGSCQWDWFCDANNYTWILRSASCGPLCPCPPPAEMGGPGKCYAETQCFWIEIPPPVICPSCHGTCHWVSAGGSWHLLTGGGCSHTELFPDGASGCRCPEPSTSAGDCCDRAETYCSWVFPNGRPTTTTTYNPCNTTTTTPDPATTTTTTTRDPCDGQCKWQWSESTGTWSNLKNTCGETCSCCPPGPAGSADCETMITSCTRMQCPTTTTKPPCSGCGYICMNHRWMLAYNNCAGDCSCPSHPAGPCALNGSKVAYPCNK